MPGPRSGIGGGGEEILEKVPELQEVRDPQSKFLTQNCSCLKELQKKKKKKIKETGKGGSVTGPPWDPSHCSGTLRPDTVTDVCWLCL